MNFDNRAVERNRFDANSNDLLALQLAEYPVQYPGLVVYIGRDVNLLRLFDVLDRAGFDVAKRTDGLIVIQPVTTSAQRSVADQTREALTSRRRN